jgi:hypothetical protein
MPHSSRQTARILERVQHGLYRFMSLGDRGGVIESRGKRMPGVQPGSQGWYNGSLRTCCGRFASDRLYMAYANKRESS